MNFQFEALMPAPFAALFELSDAELRRRDMVRVVADADAGFPCRVSLQDAAAGSDMLLLNYAHLPVASPYRSAHAIYVSREGVQAQPDVGEVPAIVASRLVSVRGFDADDMIQVADVVQGADVAQTLGAMFADEAIRYVHVHSAMRGCFLAGAVPVSQG